MTIEEKLLLKLLALFTFAITMANIFLGLFLFQLGGFSHVAIFYLYYFLFLVIAYIFSGWSLKKINTAQGMQISLLGYSLSYFLLVALGQQAIHFLPLLSIILGLSSGTFWSSNNLSQYMLTREKSRNEYFSKLNAFSSIASTIAPLIAGGIILHFTNKNLANLGYTIVFTLVSIIFFLTGFLAQKLPFHSHVQFSPKHFFKGATKRWRLILMQQFFIGLYDTAFGTFSSILIFLIVKNALHLGIINAAATLCSALVSFYTARILSQYKKSYLIGMMAISAGIFLFGYLHNIFSLVIFIVIVSGLSSFLATPTSKAILDTVDSLPGEWQEKYHFLIERDTFLGLARTLSYAFLLFFFTSNNSLEVVTTWMLCIAVIPTVIAIIHYFYTQSEKE